MWLRITALRHRPHVHVSYSPGPSHFAKSWPCSSGMPMTSPDHPLPGLLPPKILDWGQWLCFDTYLLKIKDREFRGRIKACSQNKRTKNKLCWSKESKQMLKSSCIMYKGTEISLIKEAYYIEYRYQNLYPIVSKAPPFQISIFNNPWRVYLTQDFIKTYWLTGTECVQWDENNTESASG